MDTTELKLGNLVYNHRLWVCEVIGVTRNTVEVIAGHYGEEIFTADTVHPIPLTMEIMQSLGYRMVDGGFDIGLEEPLGMYWDALTLDIVDGRGNHLIDCKYLHQLQNILDMFGLKMKGIEGLLKDIRNS